MSQALTVQDELKAKIQANSGEGEMPEFDFTPVITVDNSSEEKEIDGEKVDVRCKPRFSMQTGMEADQKEVLGESFSGVIAKIKYFVTKKWEPTSTIPFFFSEEFESGVFLNGLPFRIRHKNEGGQDEIESIDYQSFKKKFAGMYKLNAILYTIKDDQLVKIRLKGSAMSEMWTYLKIFKAKDDSVSFHNTLFTTIRKKEPQPYNALVLAVDTTSEPDLKKVIELQELLEPKEKAISGAIIEASEEISVNEVPFT